MFKDSDKGSDKWFNCLEGAHVVLLEMVSADGPVALLAVGLALGLAPIEGAELAHRAPDNQEVANAVIAKVFLSGCDDLPRGTELASRGLRLS